MATNIYTAISLFSGAGGLDVGFARNGFNVVWANDFDKDACLTYEANLGPHIECGDINTLFSKLTKYKDVDIIFGGPPCQGFSVAGKMDPNDERSKLIWSFLNTVQIVKPRAFVMENVKALATLSKFGDIRQELIKKAISLGYFVELIIVNSKDFGVPQSRERMFLVGHKKRSWTRTFEQTIQLFKKKPKTVREIITNLGKAGTSNNNRICNARITLAVNPVLRKSPYAGMLFNGQGRPMNPDTIACTLHASMGGNRTPIIDEEHLFDNQPSWVEEYHAHLISGGRPRPFESAPSFLRRLTVDEALQLQTFPANYKFVGKQSSLFKQIGNAVPCNLADSVACAARELM
ncbi:MAG: DNA cytosine methyltransferase [Legionellales bacterium]|nr:DNA cytosine methyltransferase [Legionellales bacterium]